MLAFIAFESAMRKPADKEGKVTVRATLEVAGARGNASAMRELEGPDLPEPMEYLWLWFEELDRTRAVGFGGPDPFTYPMIAAWARLTDRQPTPREVEMLLRMDLVMRHPDVLKDVN